MPRHAEWCLNALVGKVQLKCPGTQSRKAKREKVLKNKKEAPRYKISDSLFF